MFAITDLIGADTFVVSPGWLPMLSLAVLALAFASAVIAAAKGRWGWVLVGLLTGGLGWFVGAWLRPVPGSAWTRLLRNPRV